MLCITTLILQKLLQGYTFIFLWTPKGYISPEHFLNLFLNISLWLQKGLKFMMVRLLEDTFVSQKIESAHGPKQNFPPGIYHHHSSQKKITYYPQRKFSENLFFSSRDGVDCGAKKMPKIKLARILVIGFDKFHHLQLLHFWFLFCCAITEVQRLKCIMSKNCYMKDKTLHYFLTISPTIYHIKIFTLTFFSCFKKFLTSPLQNK